MSAYLSPKPEHVAHASVYDFDMYFETRYLTDPFARAAQILEQAPSPFWTPRNGGHWVITRYEAIAKAARDWEHFSSMLEPPSVVAAMQANLPPHTPPIPQAYPASIDPPEHTMYRAPLNGAFSPKTVLALKEEIRKLAVDLIEAVRPDGGCEFMSAIAEPLPVQMFMQIFGLPLERQAEYRRIVKEVLGSPGVEPKERVRRTRMLIDAVHQPLVERQSAPRNDVISMLWQLQIGGKPMTMGTMESYCLSLFLAGLDTVMNALGHGMRHFALNPVLQAQVRATPKLIPETIEEMFRLYAFASPIRVMAKDCEFEGALLRAGERVFFFLPAANRDPSIFPEPHTFDLGRDNKTHMVFGRGPHRCVGAHLARVELQVFYEELFARLPPFHLDPTKPVLYHGGIVLGPNELHLLWNT
jgi:cytochrome P450